jgi:nicotinamide-nucleotide amidase
MIQDYPKNFFAEALGLVVPLGRALVERKGMLGLAESCTGGLLSWLCTEMAGSSAWFAGGVTSYADAAKESLLGVPPGLIAAHGAVSREVVEAMSVGALWALPCDLALSVSGIAGPGGGTERKPVGTVWIGVGLRASFDLKQQEGMSHGRQFHFQGSRQEVRAAAALAALRLGLAALGQAAHAPTT